MHRSVCTNQLTAATKRGRSARSAPSSALVHLPVALGVESHPQQPVLRVVPLPATRAHQIPPPGRALMVVVLSYGERHPTTARNQEHAQRRIIFRTLLGFRLGFARALRHNGLTPLRRWRMISSCADSTAGSSCAAAATWA